MSGFMRRTSREMTEPERAWVGAFIDAEGWVSPERGKYRLEIRVSSTDPEYISALLRATGAGRVTFFQPRASHLGKKPMYSWQVQKFADALHIAAQCWDYSTKLRGALT